MSYVQATLQAAPAIGVEGAGFMSATDAGRYLAVSRSTVCNLCRAGRIPSIKVGQQYRIPVSWVAEQLGVTDGEE